MKAPARNAAPVAALVVALAVACSAAPMSAAGPGPKATRELARRLATGRGEVAIVQREADTFGEVGPAHHGTLALEPPDRLRLALEGGEVLTVRRDGGEWLQPSLGQMIRFGASGAGAATHLWGLLLGRSEDAVESPRGANGWKLRFDSEDAALDSVWLDLGPDRLPKRLVAWPSAGGRFEARLGAWKFAKAAGAKAFTQRAPKGIEVVPLGP